MKKNFTPSKESTSAHVKNLTLSVLAFLLLASSFTAMAQLQLLKDIEQMEDGDINEYSWLTSAGKHMYFVSNGELWKSNGSTKYTVRMKAFKSASNLTMSGETLYFTADDGKTGPELWKSNGSPATTVKVKDIMPGADGSFPAHLTSVNGMLFFAATSEGKGTELWKSDGTSAGTVLVKDISRGSANPQHLVNYNGILFFAATSPTGYELWKSDGTPGNTVLVKDIIGGPKSSNPAWLTVSNGKLFFVALHPQAGRELWVSDGTASGTRLLKDVLTGSQTSGPENLIHANDRLMFTANDGIHGDELWTSDGTTAGTLLVKDMNPGSAGSNNTDIFSGPMGQFTNVNGMLYFIAAKGPQDYIYRSDGTAQGTFVISKAAGVNGDDPQPAFTYRNGYVYFFNSDTKYGDRYSLYKMPYTGTVITSVRELEAYYLDEYVGADHEMIFLNGALFFPGKLYEKNGPQTGYELIRSDGTTAGTVSIHDTFAATLSSSFDEMIRVGGRVYTLHNYFLGYNPAIYSTDGTPEGTFEIRPADGYFHEWEAVAGDLYYVEERYEPTERWQLSKTSGTPETTTVIASGNGLGQPTLPRGLTDINGTLYYFNSLGEVWKSNGTATGTMRIRDFFLVFNITNVNGQAFILSGTEEGDLQLWKSNAGGLALVTTLPGTSSLTNPMANPTICIGEIFYFLARGASGGYHVWRSDGTAAGTFQMFTSQDAFFYGRVLISFNGKLYLNNGNALFETSDHAYTKIADMPVIKEYVEFKNKMFFLTGETDLRVYVSDGTPEGTVLLHQRDVEFSIYSDLTVAGDHVYFNSLRSPELWRTDGTLCGTTRVDVGATQPYALEGLGNDLIFGGYRAVTGHELYVFRNVNSIPRPACDQETFIIGNQEQGQTANLTAYPNPFADSFTLNLADSGDQRLSVAVYTLGGMPVEQVDDVAANAVSLQLGSDWPKGRYIIRVRLPERVETYHVMKE